MSNKKQKIDEQEKDKKIDYKRNLKEIWKLVSLKKGLFSWIIALLIIINIFSFADKFLFKNLVDSSTSFLSGQSNLETFFSLLLLFGIIYFAIITIRSVFNYLSHKFITTFETSLIYKIKEKYFNHILRLDSYFHSSNKTGSLISRLTRATGAFENFFDTVFFQFVPFIVQICVLVPLFFQFGIWQALTLVLTCAFYLTYSLTLNKRMMKDRDIENKTLDKEKGFIADIFMNVESVKYFGKEKVISTRFEEHIEETKAKQKKSWNWWNWISAGNSFILGIGMIALFAISLIQFSKGLLSLGEITFIYTTYLSILGPLNWFTMGIRNVSRNLTDVEGLFNYGKVKNHIKDKSTAKNLNIQHGNIEFKNISFKYPKGEKVFEDFNLKIPKGKTVALVGHSGCGKSSLVKLLYRFYDVQGGEILIDGKNIKDFKQESLRGEMAVVSQEPILFDDTLYNNVLFSNPKASKREVMEAIRFAQLDKVIEKLPQKEKTIVGERGVKLSGGQKQRVSIARALLANKKVLVLDEATSSLDSETEHDIQQDLHKLMRGKTSIVIAHRLSTIMSADIIVVMDDGQIVEKGTHRELITKGKHYKALWELQKGGYLPEE